jgi:hypothetical protein
MGYMSAPMALWYDLTSISGEVSLIKCSFASVGVLMDRALDLPNLPKISSTYLSWEMGDVPKGAGGCDVVE